MNADPTVGQLVYLNSGSPPLTITEIRRAGTKPTGDVEVSWLDIHLKPQYHVFPTVCLKEVPDEAV